MTLNEKQALFTKLIAQLIAWRCRSPRKPQPILAEVFRPPELAAIYAEQGRGIRNSNHTHKLAADIFLYKDGTITWDVEDYRALGEHWKTLHELCRWGGDFAGRDAVHFSLEHRGVR